MPAVTDKAPAVNRRQSLIKAVIFAAFIAAAIGLVRFTPAQDYLTADALSGLLASAGLWAPLAFILIYAIGVCLFVPGSILTGFGAVIFGAYWGFVYVWVGAMIGAAAAFCIGRTLGRDFAASLIGDRLRKYDDSIERNGFAAVLYLRLLYFPVHPLEFRPGVDQGPFPGLLLRHGRGDPRGDLHLYILHRHAQGRLGVG